MFAVACIFVVVTICVFVAVAVHTVVVVVVVVVAVVSASSSMPVVTTVTILSSLGILVGVSTLNFFPRKNVVCEIELVFVEVISIVSTFTC